MSSLIDDFPNSDHREVVSAEDILPRFERIMAFQRRLTLAFAADIALVFAVIFAAVWFYPVVGVRWQQSVVLTAFVAVVAGLIVAGLLGVGFSQNAQRMVKLERAAVKLNVTLPHH